MSDPALQAAVLALERLLYGLAVRICRNSADAHDLVQDVLECAFRSGERLNSVENLRSWLVTILHRRSIDLFRRRDREVLTEQLPDVAWVHPPPPDVAAWTTVTPEDLEAAIEKLPEKFRTVYRLKMVGRSYKQIADELKIPIETVGTRLLRARQRLKKILVTRSTLGGREEAGQ